MSLEKVVKVRLGRNRLLIPASRVVLFYEVWVMDVYGNLNITEGDVVLDLGANVGDFTIVASKKAGEKGIVVAVEPNPYYYSLLLENIRINKLQNVIPLNLAITDLEGTVTMDRDHLVESEKIQSSSDLFCAKSTSIDNLLSDLSIPKADIMKMDIEGTEAIAFRNQKFLNHLREFSVEIHSKESFDRLIPYFVDNGFSFETSSRTMMHQRLMQSILNHPFSLFYSEIKMKFKGTRKYLLYLFKRSELLVSDGISSEMTVVRAYKPNP